MDKLTIERRGGFAGLKAKGVVETDSLDTADRAKIDELFTTKGKLPASPGADRYIFTVTRETDSGKKTMEIPEHLLPSAVSRAVKDELP
jgi:uncharacterized protein YdeI (BOF family)